MYLRIVVGIVIACSAGTHGTEALFLVQRRPSGD